MDNASSVDLSGHGRSAAPEHVLYGSFVYTHGRGRYFCIRTA